MPASSRAIDVLGANGPRPTKRRGRNRKTLQNKESKNRSGKQGRRERESNFWSRFERMFGDEVTGMRVALGDGKPEYDIKRMDVDRPTKKQDSPAGEDIGGLKRGGAEPQQGGSNSSGRTNNGRPSTPAAPTPAPAASPTPAAPSPTFSNGGMFNPQINRFAELAQLAQQSNPRTANRNAARGEYPPALAAVPGPLRGAVMQAAEQTGLKPGVIAAVGQVESSWNTDATSSAGARGPMQTMPFWSDSADDPMGRFNPNNRPKKAIKLGAQILADYIEQQGGLKRGLMAYNAGPNNMAAGADYAQEVMRVLRDIRRR